MEHIMKKDIFTDGILNMGFGQGAIRLDLGRIGEAVENGEQPKMELVQRLVLTPEGFAQMVAAMNAMAKQLAEQGVLKTREAEAVDQKVESVNFS
ncbi:MAG: hypothetical protein JEY79_02485 [Pseudodesulfovibrio sp.]|nr:hypothetical protein [Pseudodesulfovibrio sp.]